MWDRKSGPLYDKPVIYCLVIQKGLLTVSRQEVSEYEGRAVDKTASQSASQPVRFFSEL